jgi:hypothetical protein
MTSKQINHSLILLRFLDRHFTTISDGGLFARIDAVQSRNHLIDDPLSQSSPIPSN